MKHFRTVTILFGALCLAAASAYAGRIGVLGKNTYGQFGTGTTDGATMNLTSVTQIGSDADWIDVACGKYHSLALKANGTLWAWGYNNAGQLGDGTTTNQISPVQIGSDTDWKQFDGGENFTLALKTDGTLWAWGDNSYGQFGNGTTTASLTPVQIGADNDWKVVECGASHAIAIKTDGSLWAWGYNSVGQVGNGTTTTQTTPVQIGTDKTWKKISAGGYTSLALKQDSLLWNWGDIYAASSTPVIVDNNYKFNEISASYAYPIAGAKGCFAGIGSNGIGGPKLPFLAGYYYWNVSAKKMLLSASQLIPTYRPFSDACNSCLFQIASSSLAIGDIKTKNAYSFATTTDGKLVGIIAVQATDYRGNEITSTIPWGKPIAGYEHLLVLEQTEQTVTFNALPDKAVGDADFTVSAAINAYVDAVVFTSSDESVAKCTGTNGATLQIIGTGTCTITATQAGNGCWKAAAAPQTLKVKSKPLITWSNPADIASGTALSATQLNATADVAGTFVYSPAIGSVLAAGDNQELSVIFTPTDDANYITTSYSVFIDVTKAPMKLKFTTTDDENYIKLPLYGTVDCTVDWGDGSATETFNTTGRKRHPYATAGTYTVSISGTLTQFGYYDTEDEVGWSGSNYLTEVVDFGSVGLTSLSGAFAQANNLSSVPATLPATVTDLSYCFYLNDKASITNLNSWDVSHVTNMSAAFLDASAFNQNISTWDVSAVTNMKYMFKRASAFNQPIGTWNVSSATNMAEMFKSAEVFNQPIGTWVVSSVTAMDGMFETADAFNQDISNWNVGSVTSMSSMFDWAISFNQNINKWDVSHVTDMSWMFSGAIAFNQNLADWNISSVTTMEDMFADVTLSTANYNALLIGWAAQTVKPNVLFSGGNSKYTAGAAATARGTLKGGTNLWTITDGGSSAVTVSTNEDASTISETSDVTVSSTNGILTVSTPKTFNSVTVEPGAKLDLTNALTITGDLIFKADETGSFNAKVGNAVTLATDSKVKFVKTMLDTKWYFLSFPCTVNIAEITQVGGGAFVLGTDWFIKYYNGQTRATNRGGKNWVAITNQAGTLTANQGYIIGLKTGVGTQQLSFVLDNAIVKTAETATRTVGVKVWDAGAGTHAGWNLVGQPFISQFAGNKVTGNIKDAKVTIPDATTGMTYTQPLMTGATFEPFSAYFIQAEADQDLSFDKTGRSFAPAAVATDLSDRVQLNFTSATGVDYTNLIMDNDQTTGYQIGQDLEKWIGTDTDKPQIYTQLGGVNYGYNALPMTDVQNLPVGIYTKTAGTTTISASAGQAPSLSKLLLFDSSNGTTTDLLISSYSFIADAGTNNTRFTITAQRISTESIVENEEGCPTVLINNYKLQINNLNGKTAVRVYDAIGRMVVSKTTGNSTVEIPVNVAGMYTVQMEVGAMSWVRKVVVR